MAWPTLASGAIGALVLVLCLTQAHGSLMGATATGTQAQHKPAHRHASTTQDRTSRSSLAFAARSSLKAKGAPISDEDIKTLADSVIRTGETVLIVWAAIRFFGGGRCCSHSCSCGTGSKHARSAKAVKGKAAADNFFSLNGLVSSVQVPIPNLKEGKKVFGAMFHTHRFASNMCKGATSNLEGAVLCANNGLTVLGKGVVCGVKGTFGNAIGLVGGAAGIARALVPSKKGTIVAAKAAAILGLLYLTGSHIHMLLSFLSAAGNIGATSASFMANVVLTSLGFLGKTAVTAGRFTVKTGATSVGFVGGVGLESTKVTLGTCKKALMFGKAVTGHGLCACGHAASGVVGGVSGAVGGTIGGIAKGLGGISLPKGSGSAAAPHKPKAAPKAKAPPAPKAPPAKRKAAPSLSLSIPVPKVTVPDLEILKASTLLEHTMRSAETAAVLLIALRAFGEGSCASCSGSHGCATGSKEGHSSSWWKWGFEHKRVEEKKPGFFKLPAIPKEFENLFKVVAVVGLVAVADSQGLLPGRASG